MFKAEKQFNQRTTRDSIEEAYTHLDFSIKEEEYDKRVGFPFQYPIRWLNDQSQNKRIGLRSISIKPLSTYFLIMITVRYDEDTAYRTTYEVDIQSQNTLKEILNQMSKDIVVTNGNLAYSFTYKFENNILEIAMTNNDDEKASFAISTFTDNNKINFLHFLNQEHNDENSDSLITFSSTKTFENVWDRESLYIHSSFSTARRHYLGKMNEEHDTPNKLYPGPTNDSTFYIRFTTDHVTNILPKYCTFMIELSFIINYKNATVL